MPLIPKITKGASASFSHVFDYRGWEQLQAPTSDNIISATATVSPSGLTLGAPAVDSDGDEVSVQLSAGTTGVTYRVTVLATTSGGDVLDAYLDVGIGAGIDGAVVYPSSLGPFLDTARAMELLFDDGDLADSAAVPGWETVDGNERAFFLAQASWRAVVQACVRGATYSAAELADYAADPVRGLDLIELIANLFWCRLIKRRRYVPGEPQADEAACKESEDKLQLLRLGERIFDLTGVISSGGTTYGSEIAEAGAISVGVLGGQRCESAARRFWACTGTHARRKARPTITNPGDGDCC